MSGHVSRDGTQSGSDSSASDEDPEDEEEEEDPPEAWSAERSLRGGETWGETGGSLRSGEVLAGGCCASTLDRLGEGEGDLDGEALLEALGAVFIVSAKTPGE